MKKIAILLMSLMFLGSCAHKHCSHCAKAEAACAGCKTEATAKTTECQCEKK